MKVPAIFSKTNTLESIVDAINNNFGHSHDENEIAGYYAFDAATDALDDDSNVDLLTDAEFEAHLDFLSENGAKFDAIKALHQARMHQQYAVECIHSGDA